MYQTHPEAPLWMTQKLGRKPPSPAENLNTRLMFYTFWQQQCKIWIKRVDNVENTALLDVYIYVVSVSKVQAAMQDLTEV
jgi:hypothetical protein